jgi:hypothetical protein
MHVDSLIENMIFKTKSDVKTIDTLIVSVQSELVNKKSHFRWQFRIFTHINKQTAKNATRCLAI